MTCPGCDGAGCPECALPRRGSGAPSESYYASRGYHQVKVRLPLDAIELLDRLVEAVDASRTIVLDTIIRYMMEIEQREPGELAAAIRGQGSGNGRGES
jgi:hypothetical protein